MNVLKIKVRDIKPEGLELDEKVSAKDIGVEEREDFQVTSPVRVKSKILKTSDRVLADTDIDYKYHSYCGRCLEIIEKEGHEHFLFDFPKQEFPEEIDLAEEIRQEVVMDVPLRLLCQENCKGLCGGCGVNLNNEKCKCKK